MGSHYGRFVACPVFVAAAMADEGYLICVLAGLSKAVDAVKPLCICVISKANIELSGEPAGQATRLKILDNSFILNMVEALSEGHAVAEKSGVEPSNPHKFINMNFFGPYTAYSTCMTTSDYYKRRTPLFPFDLARKNV